MIRPATIHDVPRIQQIINSHAELGKMLFKSLAQLYESLRDFVIYELDEPDLLAWASRPADPPSPPPGDQAMDAPRPAPGKIVGCAALSILWADLAEVRSVAVDDDYRGRGIGKRLVEWAEQEARRLQIRRIMCLTYERAFFEKMGFEVVSKDSLPLKVWSDCVRCPKRDDCDEIAMVRCLHDVPVIAMAPAPPTPRGLQIPVLQDTAED